MKRLSEFDIELVRLKPGIHEFDFQLGEAFFESYEYGIIRKGNLTVKVVLERSSALLKFDIGIEGTVELICDRSLESFDYPLSIRNQVMMKFGEEEQELADDVFVIKPDKQVVNLSDLIYEFITVNIPIKKLHPRFQEDEEEEDELIYSSMTEEEQEKEKQEKEEDIDPRWKELLKLKNNKK